MDDIKSISTKPPSNRIGIKDIAKQAGVSLSTVSLVMNDKPGISDEIRERVKGVAKELGYEPRPRSSPQKTTSLIILPSHIEKARKEGAVQEIYDEYLEGFDAAAEELGLELALIPNVAEEMGELFIRLLTREVDKATGVIFCSLSRLNDPALSFLKSQDLPIVLLNRVVDDPNISCVSIDYHRMVNYLISRLIEEGAKRVLYFGMGPKRSIHNRLKIKAYEDALKDNGIELHEDMICLEKKENEISQIIAQHMKNTKELAIYVSSNHDMEPIIKTIESMGLRPGRDILIAGGEYLETAPINFDLIHTGRLPYFESSYQALKLVDVLSKNPSLDRVKAYIEWEYMAPKVNLETGVVEERR